MSECDGRWQLRGPSRGIPGLAAGITSHAPEIKLTDEVAQAASILDALASSSATVKATAQPSLYLPGRFMKTMHRPFHLGLPMDGFHIFENFLRPPPTRTAFDVW